jgi:transposase-like protein
MEDFPRFCASEDEARQFLEEKRWPAGSVCPFCRIPQKVYALDSKPESTHRLRGGVYKCAGCRRKFTVRQGTVFEDSRIPLHKWLLAMHLMCVTQKGLNAAELQRELGLRSYRTALLLTHRIEWALSQTPFAEEMKASRRPEKHG